MFASIDPSDYWWFKHQMGSPSFERKGPTLVSSPSLYFCCLKLANLCRAMSYLWENVMEVKVKIGKTKKKTDKYKNVREWRITVKLSNRLQHHLVSGIVTHQIASVPSVYLYPHAANRCPRAQIHQEKNRPRRRQAAVKKHLFGEVAWVSTQNASRVD